MTYLYLCITRWCNINIDLINENELNLDGQNVHSITNNETPHSINSSADSLSAPGISPFVADTRDNAEIGTLGISSDTSSSPLFGENSMEDIEKNSVFYIKQVLLST